MNFGNQLREARERRGVSLRQIAASTRISLRTLEALENNEIGKLPGGIFSRAFVRSYANEVGLDPDEAVREFVEQFPLDHVTAGTATAAAGDVARGEEAERRRQQFGLLVTLAIIIPIAALVLYFVFSGRRSASAADGSVDTVASGSAAAAAPASGPALTPASNTTASGAPGTSAARPASAAASGAPAAAGAFVLAPDRPIRLRIEPDGPCWVKVRADGVVRHEKLMQKGDVYTEDARNDFEVVVGDTGTFRFALNDRPGRSLGGPGQVMVARIARDNVADWLQAVR